MQVTIETCDNGYIVSCPESNRDTTIHADYDEMMEAVGVALAIERTAIEKRRGDDTH